MNHMTFTRHIVQHGFAFERPEEAATPSDLAKYAAIVASLSDLPYISILKLLAWLRS